MRWLIREWPSAVLVTAGFLFALAPLVGTLGWPLLLVYLQLPLYMIHQFEEHHHDRFRTFVNEVIAGGRDVLTPGTLFVINSVGVWGVDLLSLYLARYAGLAFGLLAVYLTLVNAVIHIGVAIGMRRYNPGLWTSVALFLPFGAWALVSVSAAAQAGWTAHALAAGTVIAVHALIVVQIKRRLRMLERRNGTQPA